MMYYCAPPWSKCLKVATTFFIFNWTTARFGDKTKPAIFLIQKMLSLTLTLLAA